MVLLAYPLLGPFDRDRVVAHIGFHPILIIGRPPAQRLLADLRHPDDLTEEVDDQLRPRQRRQIAVNDNPVEAVIDEDQEVAEQLGEQIHGSPLRYPAGIERRSGVDRANRWWRGRAFALADEVRYIQRRAADRHGGVVTVGQLVLLSTETGDARLLDPSDQLAARLARDGDPEPVHIGENDTSFIIDWKGDCRIEGPAFIYSDRPDPARLDHPRIPHAPARATVLKFQISLARACVQLRRMAAQAS